MFKLKVYIWEQQKFKFWRGWIPIADHDLRPIFTLWLVKIMRKIYAASENLFADSLSWRSFVSSCDVFNCIFPRDVQNEIHLLSRSFKIIHDWFVYWVFGWLMRRLSKS